MNHLLDIHAATLDLPFKGALNLCYGNYWK